MTPEQKAAIRARLKDGYVDVTTWDDATAIEDDVRDLLAALDQCELERDRETELRRAAEGHNSTLRAALDVKPYPNEYDDAVLRAEKAEQQLAEARRLIVEWRKADKNNAWFVLTVTRRCANELAHALGVDGPKHQA